MSRFFVFIILIFGLKPSLIAQNPVIIPLNDGWSAVRQGDTTLYKAYVPGNIFADLTKNGVIPHPYCADYEKAVQGISSQSWIYRKTFVADSTLLAHKHIELIFEGLDTYAGVFVNGRHALQADNMFVRWRIPLKQYGLLQAGKNTISVRFTPPQKKDSTQAANFRPPLPDPRAFTRKAPYQYGWDWAARLITMGIWKNVYLLAWDEFIIDDFYIRQEKISDTLAKLTVMYDLRCSDSMISRIDLFVNDSLAFTDSIMLMPGVISAAFELNLKNPKLWYPRGYGKQNLYDFRLQVSAAGQTATKRLTTGLRDVKLIRHKDSIGSTFYLTVNGQRIFVRGANYIPQSLFPSQVSDSAYTSIVKLATQANLNMLRIWGGGYYLPDTFYSLCDRYGLLVWQDFMFACNFYPGTPDFFSSVKTETEQQVMRLSRHPSIVLWCGNNEVKEAWFNWGYQRQLGYSADDSILVWHWQKELFEIFLPATVSVFSPRDPYIPTSPANGWGRSQAYTEGDVHFWGVWWARWPFEAYRRYVGRFVSEYGFQAFPHMKTLLEVLDTSQLWLDHPALLNHQKHPFGNENLQNYTLRYFGLPAGYFSLYRQKQNIPPLASPSPVRSWDNLTARDTVRVFRSAPFDLQCIAGCDGRLKCYDYRAFSGLKSVNPQTLKRLNVLENYIFLTQLTQAYGIETAIDAHRSAKPYCMGTMFWQWNDAWPVISWSAIDWFGHPKALFYRLKQVYATIYPVLREQNGRFEIVIVSDSSKPVQGTMILDFYSASGKKIRTIKQSSGIPADTIISVLRFSKNDYDTTETYIFAHLLGTDNEPLSSRVFLLTYPKFLNRQNPAIRLHSRKKGKFYEIILKSRKPVYAIQLIANTDGRFDNNFLAMQPGHKYKIRFYPTDKTKTVRFRYIAY